MAPEFVLDGVFSVKSDVYSFGVLMLEILAGKKNGPAHFKQYGLTLLRQVLSLSSSSPDNLFPYFVVILITKSTILIGLETVG